MAKEKRKGKIRRIISLILLLTVAGAIFYFGWIQLKLEKNQHAVIYTKTSGYSDKIISNSKFNWSIEKLIPTNMSILIFDVVEQSAEIKSTGILPSGDIYSKALEGNPDFSYDIEIILNYTLKPETLPNLVSQKGLKPDTILAWYDDFEKNCRNEIIEYIQITSMEDNLSDKLLFQFSSLEDELKKKLSLLYRNVIFNQIIPVKIKFPDMKLYEIAKSQYIEIQTLTHKLNSEILKQSSEEQLKETVRMEILKKYGDLFNQYPILLDYIALWNEEDRKILTDNIKTIN